jgi:cobalt-precorrin 5A hydrolase
MVKIETGKYKFICFTEDGQKLMTDLCDKLSGKASDSEAKQQISQTEQVTSLGDWTLANFKTGNILIYIGPIAIAIRAIAPFVKDKTTDPGVIVIDEQGTFVVPILSGHIGGAIDAAREMAELISAVPVITTATDLRGEFAVDVFAKRNNLEISDIKMAKEFTAKLLAGEDAVFTVSPRKHKEGLSLIPRCIVIGMGCRKGKEFEKLYQFLTEILEENNIDPRALRVLTSIDLKKDEEGLNRLADKLRIPFMTYSAEELMKQEGDFEKSDFALDVTGADNICERSVMAYGAEKLLVKKTARDGMTIAIGIYLGQEENE